MNGPKFLILSGDGINCERETAWAFKEAGGVPTIVHINDLLERPSLLNEFQGMAIPGGFSFGDELGSGQVLALKIKHGLKEAFTKFVDDKKPIIGICNGFQVLVKLGLLPYPKDERVMALAANKDGQFIDRWTQLNLVDGSVCKWTEGLNKSSIELPVRHGEGRVVFAKGKEEEIFNTLSKNGQIPFCYDKDFNGSYKNIAAVCDPTGLILGMMPHPEAYLFEATYKNKKADPFAKGMGQHLFDNIIKYLEGVK
ncbi:MAG: phosphoribosylformylglycinamidine synthase subunit PurQ [Epsilonproteobacteria bacterium]|nr:MAG: phosphoribosylformylglycinamidine synthase subunit PurQ [Campylobacterota bacterium]RLA63686.1 MAG: phosphoribosylformylglycinamidine synthase subunit PurQ [Campylobacterota bacterium]